VYDDALRCPPGQADEFYIGLKWPEKEVEYVLCPGGSLTRTACVGCSTFLHAVGAWWSNGSTGARPLEHGRQAVVVVVEDVVLGTAVVDVDVVVELGTVVDVVVGTVVAGAVVVVVVVAVVVVAVVVVVVSTRAQVDSALATKWEEQIVAELLPAMEHRAAIA
jgi:hypothetical protein